METAQDSTGCLFSNHQIWRQTLKEISQAEAKAYWLKIFGEIKLFWWINHREFIFKWLNVNISIWKVSDEHFDSKLFTRESIKAAKNPWIFAADPFQTLIFSSSCRCARNLFQISIDWAYVTHAMLFASIFAISWRKKKIVESLMEKRFSR